MTKQAERHNSTVTATARANCNNAYAGNSSVVTLQPGSTIGILGSGQLGRMLAMAAARLGLRCHVYSETATGPACEVCAHQIVGSYKDVDKLQMFTADVDAVTYEFENVPLSAVQHIASLKPVYPPPRALEIAQDRLIEKQFIADLGIAVAPFVKVSSKAELTAGVDRLGTPAILKNRFSGYDGKGQVHLTQATDLSQAYLDVDGGLAILEGFVRFEREISVILARGIDPAAQHRLGEVIYDIPVNTHKGGILRQSKVPAPIDEETRLKAEDIACRIARAFDYIGILVVELFDTGPAGKSRLIVNEIAPRVHNTGHWTMGACCTDQFENHIRAVAGWPLGSTERFADAEMVNLIGKDINQWHSLLAEPGACVHIYGKDKIAPDRKMGHVNKLKVMRR